MAGMPFQKNKMMELSAAIPASKLKLPTNKKKKPAMVSKPSGFMNFGKR